MQYHGLSLALEFIWGTQNSIQISYGQLMCWHSQGLKSNRENMFYSEIGGQGKWYNMLHLYPANANLIVINH